MTTIATRSSNHHMYVLYSFLHLWIWWLVLMCVSRVNSDPECLPINDRYECRNLRSMQELLGVHMQVDWTRVTIVNSANWTFTNAEHINQLLRNIVELDLSRAGKLIITDRAFRVFDELKSLNISNGQLRFLEASWFATYNQIEHLNATHNSLMLINPSTVAALRSLLHLSTLDLSYNDIDVMPDNCFEHFGLRELIIRSNGMQSLTPIGHMPRLLKLDLNDNSLKQINQRTFIGLNVLKFLDLSLNQINELEPNCFDGLQTTQVIDLSQNSLTLLPTPLLPTPNNLKTLDLHDNILSHFATNPFHNLAQLTKIDLSKNNLKSLNTSTFYGLDNLQTLHLNHNDIRTIQSNTFGHLTHLQELDLSSNSLRTLNGQYFGNTLPNLRRLFIKSNHLHTLHPSSFEHLPQLNFLVLAFNELSTLPSGLFNSVQSLRKLHLYKNRIEFLDGDLFKNLAGLKELYLNFNRISFFPNISVQFTMLERATLEANPWQCACFDELSEMLMLSSSMVTLKTEGNPYYSGEKPVCVVADAHCVKDIDEVRRRNLLASYDEAFASN